jgi:deoxyribodipyrimidine photo-lyase
MVRMTTLVWLRNDLRLSDNPALTAAAERGQLIPLYVFDSADRDAWRLGGAQRWWLHQSLAAFERDLQKLGSRLVIRHGAATRVIDELIASGDIDAVYWNRRYEPTAIAHDSKLKESLRARSIDVQSFNSALLHEPWEVRNQSGKPFQVFTPFWRHCMSRVEPRTPEPQPKQLRAPSRWPTSESLESLELMPKQAWYAGMAAAWSPGERGAQQQLRRFLQDGVWSYRETRDFPGMRGTSQLSPHLHFGEISPHQLWHAVKTRATHDAIPANEWRMNPFITEIGWREFAHHLLFHFPTTPTAPLRAQFERFPWIRNAAHLRAWQRGRTGVPMIDAGMRQLWSTGWMHNRVRMIVASFLVKNLLLPWQDGARWFWDTLVDADLASNTLGWQWAAGCGADAAPYFRVFNPVSQGSKFDPEGHYVRAWIPELARVPTEYLHAPWQAPTEVLAGAGVRIGHDYPAPIVDLKETRERALVAYQAMRTSDS